MVDCGVVSIPGRIPRRIAFVPARTMLHNPILKGGAHPHRRGALSLFRKFQDTGDEGRLGDRNGFHVTEERLRLQWSP